MSVTTRTAMIRSAERIASDVLPACPRCSDLLAPGARYCPECGCAVTVERVSALSYSLADGTSAYDCEIVDNAVEGGDK